MSEILGVFILGAALGYAFNRWVIVRVVVWFLLGLSLATTGFGDGTVDGSAWKTVAAIAGILTGTVLSKRYEDVL